MNIIKKKVLSIFESRVLKQGCVLEVRAWNPATFFEIDLHLPGVDMDKWTSVQHMKVKVSEYTYRDYTPALWDAETETCTLCIDSAHSGPGSDWVKGLKRGDTISYVGIGSTFHKPVADSKLLCLGDSSSIGHFLALKQLALGIGEVYGAISFDTESHAREFSEYFDTYLQPIKENKRDVSLVSWLNEQDLSNETIYIAGHIPTAMQLRTHLKLRNDFNGSIKLQGFWH
ncbi:ferredoxin reductase domain-containing protein [Pedobacter cryoconitis]|uniref:FAD-binding FR-type domain-containing protein n=1 Tax=Pedobacter cryoconitis TaxID=188932 RepID=A0A327T3A3_9SPHI|nr:hypothetical protein [Pedobacter cryoconitis]RAJ32217.1 hypothetical protein LY11_01900 [Pedobacter cryoconitis]